MTDFDLSKITGREPPVETDEDMMNALADALGYAEALRTENEALRDHRDQLTEDLGSLEDRMQELLARVASEYRNGHAAGQEAAMESVAALRARVAEADALLKRIAADWPTLECEHVHHGKADRHGDAVACPVLRRWDAVGIDLNAWLAGAAGNKPPQCFSTEGDDRR